MTQIGASLGGTPAPAGRTEWRGPALGPRGAVDWNDKQYATPGPSPKTQFGRRVEPKVADVPILPERNIRVKAKPPATFYTPEGIPIPADDWTTLPISPGLIQAVKDGDLERGPDPVDEPTPQQPGRHGRHHQPAVPQPDKP